MTDIANMDRALDGMLMQLGAIVLRLSDPQVTRTDEERHALAQSVNQFSVCAARTGDPRVQALKAQLVATLRPRLVASK